MFKKFENFNLKKDKNEEINNKYKHLWVNLAVNNIYRIEVYVPNFLSIGR